MPESGAMSDPVRPGSSGFSIAAAAACLVFLSIVAPALIVVVGLVHSAPFFGEQPSEATRSGSVALIWAAFCVSAVSLIAIAVTAIANCGRRGLVALVVIAVLASVVAAFWLIVAFSAAKSN
jgi:hypothetical protein